MDIPYKIIREKTLSDRWGKLREIIFETADASGKYLGHKGELYDAGNAVAVLLYNKARGTVLLNRQFRIATVYNGNPSGMLTELCAGKIEDLSADETVLKEAFEETGYKIYAAQKVMSVYMSPGAFTERLELYVAEYQPQDKQSEGGGLKKEGEQIEVSEVSFREAMAMIERGEILDAKTIMLLQYAALKQLL